jgi:hypothetical protein
VRVPGGLRCIKPNEIGLIAAITSLPVREFLGRLAKSRQRKRPTHRRRQRSKTSADTLSASLPVQREDIRSSGYSTRPRRVGREWRHRAVQHDSGWHRAASDGPLAACCGCGCAVSGHGCGHSDPTRWPAWSPWSRWVGSSRMARSPHGPGKNAARLAPAAHQAWFAAGDFRCWRDVLPLCLTTAMRPVACPPGFPCFGGKPASRRTG